MQRTKLLRADKKRLKVSLHRVGLGFEQSPALEGDRFDLIAAAVQKAWKRVGAVYLRMSWIVMMGK